MLMLDANTAVIFDSDDLRYAAEDIDINYVYFGADIQLAFGITINQNKSSIVFDGLYEDTIHAFSDMNSTAAGNTLGIGSAVNMEITFQNIVLYGRNYYGIPYVPNSSAYSGISLIYNNVTYRGSQIVHNPYGSVKFIDCDISIVPLTPPAASEQQEVGEVCRVEIGGTTNIRKTNAAHSVFWFYGTSVNPPSLKILSGANVTIRTANYFMYVSYPVTYTIEDDAEFSLETAYSISYGSAHRAASFSIGENAVFRYMRAASGISAVSLYINGEFAVAEDASVYMQSDIANTGAMIRFMQSDGDININNPKSFVIYNRGTSSSAAAMSFAATKQFSICSGQVNYWHTAKELLNAGDFNDIPASKWNRPSWNTFTISGTAYTTTNTTFDDFSPSERALLPELSDLQFQTARVLSMGSLPLSISPVYSQQVQITGVTQGLANVLVTLPGGGISASGTANEDGYYSVLLPEPVPLAEVFEVSANTPFLIVSIDVTAAEPGELTLDEVPELLEFVLPPVFAGPPPVLGRKEPGARVVISDLRETKTTWRLLAAVEGEFETADGHILPDAIIYIDEGGVMTPLSQTAAAVYESAPTGGSMTFEWDDDKGILARILAPVRNRETYSTRLVWSLEED